MAKVTAPLLSFGAAGQIGKAQVYAAWRGIAYARQLVTPRNPNTTGQQSTRNVFTSVSGLWKNLGSLARAPWTRFVVGRPLTARNAIIGQNVKAMRGQPDRTDFIASPGAFGGPAPTNVAAAPGASAGEIDVTITSPSAPTGWTLTAAIAFAMQDGDPSTIVPLPLGEAEDLAPVVDGDTTITLTGLESGQLHVAFGWLEWAKPDGSVAYGASLSDTATPS